jgi:IS5 family transposase
MKKRLSFSRMLNVFKAIIIFLEKGASNKLRLSLNLNDVACFNKGKLHKNYEFGRAYQLMRLAGNFVMVLANTDRMHDKHSTNKVINMHQNYFGENAIESATADKGYYSSDNEDFLLTAGVKEIGISRPGNIKKELLHPTETVEKLQNRCSGIEPIIGHIKHKGQMGRSRMIQFRASD